MPFAYRWEGQCCVFWSCLFSMVVYKGGDCSSGYRVSVILYTWQVINNFFIRENVSVGPAIQNILQLYSLLAKKHLYQTNPSELTRYISTLQPTWQVNGIHYYNIKCNLHPTVYTLPLITAITLMMTVHYLDFTKTVSLLQVFTGLPNTTHYIISPSFLFCWWSNKFYLYEGCCWAV